MCALSNTGLPSPGTVAIRLPDPSTCEVIPSEARYWARCSRIFSSCPDVLGMRIKSISVVERRSEYISASLLSACTVSLIQGSRRDAIYRVQRGTGVSHQFGPLPTASDAINHVPTSVLYP